MSDLNNPSPDRMGMDRDDHDTEDVDGGAAPETPEGQELAADPDGSGTVDGGAPGLDEDAQTSDLDAMDEGRG